MSFSRNSFFQVMEWSFFSIKRIIHIPVYSLYVAGACFQVLWDHHMWRADLSKWHHAVRFSSALQLKWIMIIISMTQSPPCTRAYVLLCVAMTFPILHLFVSMWNRELQAHPFSHPCFLLLSPSIFYHPIKPNLHLLSPSVCSPGKEWWERAPNGLHPSTLGVEGTKRGQTTVGIVG